MSGCNKFPKSDQHSIKYRSKQHRGSSIEADLSCVDYKPSLSNNECKKSYRSSEPKSPEILSTPQLISVIGRIWDSASRPLSLLLPKANVNEDDKWFKKEKILDSIDEKRNGWTFILDNTNYFPVNMRATGYGSNVVQEKLDFPKVRQKMSVFESCSDSEDYILSLFQRFGQAGGNNSNKYQKVMVTGSGEITLKSGNVYSRMRRNAPTQPWNQSPDDRHTKHIQKNMSSCNLHFNRASRTKCIVEAFSSDINDNG